MDPRFQSNADFGNPYAATAQDLVVPGEADELVPADRATRLGAAILDTLFIVAFGIVAAILVPATAGADNEPSPIVWIVIGAGILAVVVTQLVFIARYGQTIGKRITKIRVVHAETGEKCSFGRYVGLRVLVTGLIGAIPIVGHIFSLVDPLMIFREDRRCVHDHIANTMVVKV